MHNRYILIAALLLLPSYATAQTAYRGNCESVCARVVPWATQSRGDPAWYAELQRLQNECQSCQLQSHPRPSARQEPPQFNPPAPPPGWLDSTPPPQQSGNFLSNAFDDFKSWWKGPNINSGQTLSSDVQQRNIKILPSGSEIAKWLTDPFKPAAPAQPPAPSFDSSQLKGMKTLQQPLQESKTSSPPSTSAQFKNCYINQATYEFSCGNTGAFAPAR
jgi:hypothetical protein